MPLFSSPAKNNYYIPTHLQNRLEGIFNYPATVVAAPSGFGKTTTIKEYLKKALPKTGKECWYTSFGERPETAWNRICALISRVDEEVGKQLSAFAYPSQENLAEIAEIMQGLTGQDEWVLVIDNYHLLQMEAPYGLIMALSQHSSEGLHIVALTQQLKGKMVNYISAPQVFMLNEEDFRFDNEDIAAYFQLYGFTLSEAQIQQIQDNTFGWIAALRLQLLDYRKNGSVETCGDIEELWRTALWNRISRKEQKLLLAMSLFEEMTIQQVCLMIGTEELPQYAEKLLHGQSLIEVDGEKCTLTLQGVIRTFLQKQFAGLTNEEQRELYYKAGQAYCSTAENYNALKCFLHAEAYEELLSIPFGVQDFAGQPGDEVEGILEQIVTQCPREQLLGYPRTLLVFAFILFLRSKPGCFLAYCQLIGDAIEGLDNEDSYARRLRGEFAFLHAFCEFNDIKRMTDLYKEALEKLGGPTDIFTFQHAWTLGAPSILYQYWSESGQLAKEMEQLEEAIPYYVTLTKGHGMGANLLMRAEAALNAGELDEAVLLCQKTLYVADKAKQDCICLGAELTLIRIAILGGDQAGYHEHLEQMHDRMLAGHEAGRHLVYERCKAFVGLLMNVKSNIPKWLYDEQEIEKYANGSLLAYGRMLYGKLLLMEQNYAKLEEVSGLILDVAKEKHLLVLEVYYLIYLACSKSATGKPKEAREYLSEALSLALPDQIYLPFAEHGELLLELLKNEKASPVFFKGIERILELYHKQTSGVLAILQGTDTIKDTLTPREYEIVQLAIKGMTNKEIAEQLYITAETVKMAMKKIFAKLGIHSRLQLKEKII